MLFFHEKDFFFFVKLKLQIAIAGGSGYVATSTQELIKQQIRQQEQLVLHQDSQLSQMSQSVGTLRNVSTAIGSELDEQAVMLDEFGAEIEQAETKLDATMRKMVSSRHITSFRHTGLCLHQDITQISLE